MSRRRRLQAVSAALAMLVVVAGGGTVAAEAPPIDHGSTTTIRGTVRSVDPPFGFVLEDGTFVLLEQGAQWDGLHDVADLVPGDSITVIGSSFEIGGRLAIKAGGVRVAAPSGRVVPIGSPVCLPPRLAPPGKKSTRAARAGLTALGPPSMAKSEDEFEVEGIVVSVAEESFLLDSEDDDRYTVLVNEETEFEDLEDLEDLEDGDPVRVRGALDGDVITASRVELSEGGDGGGSEDGDGVDFESTGVVTELLPPDSFAFSDQRTYRVDGLTEFDGHIQSYSGLAVGQFLEVKAVYEGGSAYRAVKIEFEGDDDGGQGYRSVEGTIAAVSAVDVTLTDDTLLFFTATTQFNGDADRREDLRPGWEVEATVALRRIRQLLAIVVRAENPAPSTTTDQEYEPHEAVLVLVDGADPQAVASRHNGEVSGQVSTLGSLLTWQREIDDELLAQLAADPDVMAVEPNFLFRDPESTRRRFVIVDRSPTVEKYTGQTAATAHGLAKAHTVSDGQRVGGCHHGQWRGLLPPVAQGTSPGGGHGPHRRRSAAVGNKRRHRPGR